MSKKTEKMSSAEFCRLKLSSSSPTLSPIPNLASASASYGASSPSLYSSRCRLSVVVPSHYHYAVSARCRLPRFRVSCHATTDVQSKQVPSSDDVELAALVGRDRLLKVVTQALPFAISFSLRDGKILKASE